MWTHENTFVLWTNQPKATNPVVTFVCQSSLKKFAFIHHQSVSFSTDITPMIKLSWYQPTALITSWSNKSSWKKSSWIKPTTVLLLKMIRTPCSHFCNCFHVLMDHLEDVHDILLPLPPWSEHLSSNCPLLLVDQHNLAEDDNQMCR